MGTGYAVLGVCLGYVWRVEECLAAGENKESRRVRRYSFSDGFLVSGCSTNLPSGASGSLFIVLFGMKLADRGVVEPSSQNSTSPSALKEPRFTSWPFSRMRSSIVTDLSEKIY